MKKHLVTFLVILSLSVVTLADSLPGKIVDNLQNIEKASVEVVDSFENELDIFKPLFEETSTRGWILNSKGKKIVKNILLQLPCGWPEYGIPPLAPYTNELVVLNLNKSKLETTTKLNRFRVDGLDIMLINKLKISYTFGKKVKYSFTFPKIRLTGKIDSDTLLRLLNYGLSIRFDGKGDFEVTLENLTIEGSFKYKLPFIFGSIKIYKFKSVLTLGNVLSEIKFEGTAKKVNELLNGKIEDYIMESINENQKEISKLMEETFVPLVNKKMKGHKIWYLIGKLAGSSKVCYPPPIPWETSDNEVL